jgi:hypothetical protein
MATQVADWASKKVFVGQEDGSFFFIDGYGGVFDQRIQ